MTTETTKEKLDRLERRLDLIIVILRNLAERISCVNEVKEADAERLKRQSEYG